MEAQQITSEQEEMMGTLRQLLKFNTTLWSLAVGLFLAGLLAGCHTPLVNVEVTVDTCQAGGMGKPFGEPPEKPGACNVYPAGSTPYTGDAYGFLKTTDGQPFSQHQNCSGGKRCTPGTPGRCDSGPKTGFPCASWVNPSTMTCSCSCPPS